MATFNELTESLERALAGAVKSDESKFDRAYLGNEINKGRAVVARNDYLQHKRWNPSLIQFYYPEYSTFFQSGSCRTRFRLPSGFISADGLRTGCTYVGSSNDIDTANPMKARNYRIIKHRAELNDFLNDPLMSPASGGYIGVLIEGRVMEVYSNTIISNLGVGGVWDDPTALPDYSVTKDDYPASEDLLEMIIVYVKDAVLNQAAATPPDKLSSSSGVYVPMNTGRRIQRNISG